ncbi:dihydroxyacetone kinase [Bacilli bacterium]|nr:dihydroxyacetone kinase [Bacilli bacterium]
MFTLSADKLKKMFMSGSEAIGKEYEYINELNVFPVPDGDTGSNMMITVNGACEAIQNVEYEDLHAIGKAFARGLLMNARGNSGVILSQIIKGFVSSFIEGKKEVGVADFVKCFSNAKNTAYAALVTPVEGTILTVIRVTAENLNKKINTFKSIEDVMKTACKEAQAILLRTPEFLPELKEVGVVDSGGYGLCRFFDGMLLALKSGNAHIVKQVPARSDPNKVGTKKSFIESLDDKNEGFGYCCEFIMTLKSKVSLHQKDKSTFNLTDFKKQMSKIGDSLAVIVDESIVKVHIHTINPYLVLKIGAEYGEFNKVKVENMTFQFLERNPGTTLEATYAKDRSREKKLLPTRVKVIATVPSTYLEKLYKQDLGVSLTINTNLTGNPSIQDFLKKIHEANSSRIIIVVDDSNIILAATEAIKLTPEDIQVDLINAKDIAASYLACLSFDPIQSLNENVKIMHEVIDDAVVGKISKATKVVKYSHIEINKNDAIGIMDKKVVASRKNTFDCAKELCDLLRDQIRHPKNAYLIFGANTELRDIKAIKKYLNEVYDLKVTMIRGGQDVYSYYIAIQ